MIIAKEQFVVDENGTRTAVLLEIERYESLLAAQEELESIRAFDEAKAADDEAVSLTDALKEIEETRK